MGLFGLTVAGLLLAGTAVAQVAPEVASEVASLAPTGRLRAAINFGNPVLAQRVDGVPGGVPGRVSGGVPGGTASQTRTRPAGTGSPLPLPRPAAAARAEPGRA